MNVSEKMNAAEGEAGVQNHGIEDGQRFDLDSLPLGYRFSPTDEELLLYLSNKAHHQPLPTNKIIELNLYAHHPEQLAATYKAQGKNEWFYFTPRDRKYPKGQRPNRDIGGGRGHWKATGLDIEIIDDEGRKVGCKRSLIFYQGSHPAVGVKTDWIMHEFILADPPQPLTRDFDGNLRLDDCVLCKVYKNIRSDRRSRISQDDQPWNDATTSSSIIPKPGINPNTEVANDQLTATGGMYHAHNPFVNIPQSLQNLHEQKQPINVEMQPQTNLQVLSPARAYVSLYTGSGASSSSSKIPEFTNYAHNPFVNIPQRLHNRHEQQQPQVSSAYAVFPQTNLQVLPLVGADVSLCRGSGASSSSSKIPEFTNYAYNPFVNIPQRLQNQHDQKQQHPVVQKPQFPSAYAVFPKTNLQVLPPVGADVFLHRDSEILWNDQSTNDASSSSSKIPKLKHSSDHESENQLTVSRGMGYVQVYAPFINNIHDQSHQNRHEQKQPTVEMPQIPSANAVYPHNNSQVLASVGADEVSLPGQNDNPVQVWEGLLTGFMNSSTEPMSGESSNPVLDNQFYGTPDQDNDPYV